VQAVVEEASGPAKRRLVEQSRTADLMVVGARRHHSPAAALLGGEPGGGRTRAVFGGGRQTTDGAVLAADTNRSARSRRLRAQSTGDHLEDGRDHNGGLLDLDREVVGDLAVGLAGQQVPEDVSVAGRQP